MPIEQEKTGFGPPLYPDCAPITGDQKIIAGDNKNEDGPPCPLLFSESLVNAIKNRNSNTHIYREINNREKRGTIGDQTSAAEQKSAPVPDVNSSQILFRDIMASPLKNLCWWDLLMCLWNLADDHKCAWAGSFPERIVKVDISNPGKKQDEENKLAIDWLKKAMNHTWAAITDDERNILREEYRAFLDLDKVCDWVEMVKGHEYLAAIGFTLHPDAIVRRVVRGWSLKAAKSKIKIGKNEILLGWQNPGDKDYTPVAKDVSGEVPF